MLCFEYILCCELIIYLCIAVTILKDSIFNIKLKDYPRVISIQDFCICNKSYLTIFYRNGTRTTLSSILSDDKKCIYRHKSMKYATSIESIGGAVAFLFSDLAKNVTGIKLRVDKRTIYMFNIIIYFLYDTI